MNEFTGQLAFCLPSLSGRCLYHCALIDNVHEEAHFLEVVELWLHVTFALPIAPEREGPGDEILWDELSCGAANEK